MGEEWMGLFWECRLANLDTLALLEVREILIERKFIRLSIF